MTTVRPSPVLTRKRAAHLPSTLEVAISSCINPTIASQDANVACTFERCSLALDGTLIVGMQVVLIHPTTGPRAFLVERVGTHLRQCMTDFMLADATADVEFSPKPIPEGSPRSMLSHVKYSFMLYSDEDDQVVGGTVHHGCTRSKQGKYPTCIVCPL